MISCEMLTGTFVATNPVARGEAEWPPHPARLFSAFVAAWAEHGADDLERQALDFLESLDPPEVHAPQPGHRDLVTVYVPPNDGAIGRPMAPLPTTKKALVAAAGVLPALRTNRQPRTFPATPLPADSRVVRFVWPNAEVPAAISASLAALASRVPYLGHSSSLVRIAVEGARVDSPSDGDQRWRPGPDGTHALRVWRPGQRQHLERLFAEGRRPDPGAFCAYALVGDEAPSLPQGVFSDRWLVLRSEGGLVPALEAWPYVAWMLRRALLGQFFQQVAARLDAADRVQVAACLSGHDPDGQPLSTPHLAVVPMANVGWGRHATGAVMGAALVLPRAVDGDLLMDVLLAVISGAAQQRADATFTRDGVLVLKLGAAGEWWLSTAAGDGRPSLSGGRYCRAASSWATATPLVLDRFPKADGDAEACVRAACAHLGLPEPVDVVTHKHSAVSGAPASRPRRGLPDAEGGWRVRWRDETGRVASRFGGRPLTHVTLRFATPIRGPVLLGAGRYHGLGLCLPVDEARDA
jgi:CRISPR-associated protein Csb2